MLANSTIVVVLPDGGALGGVTTWAATVCQAHTSIGGSAFVVGPGVERPAWPSGAVPIDAGDLTSGTAEAIRRADDGPVVVVPTLSGVAYASAATAASASVRSDIHLLGSMHTDIRYDTELIRRFAPGLSGVLCVSESARQHLLNHAAVDPDLLSVLPSGVPAATAAPATEPAHDPLRLLYVGRLDPFQKRAACLGEILKRVTGSGVRATLTVVGDGPARDALVGQDGIDLLGAIGGEALPEIYATHDLLLLPSRSEGLGLARIEAAMHGCVPVVTPGGASEGITHGESGVVVPCPFEMGDSEVAEMFSAAIISLAGRDLAPIRDAARSSANERFGMHRFGSGLRSLLGTLRTTESMRSAWRRWAEDPEAAARFTVPDDAAECVRSVAANLRDTPVLIHGDGAHTDAVWEAVLQSGLRVVGIADDDPQRWGRRRDGIPVIAPSDAVGIGAEAVLLSSWLHEDALWAKRAVYTDAGLSVHRVYRRA